MGESRRSKHVKTSQHGICSIAATCSIYYISIYIMHIHGINFRNHLGMKSPAALFLKSSQSLLWKLSKTWGKQRDASDTNPMSSGLTPVTSPSTRCDPQGNQRVLKTQNALLGNLQFGCFQRWWYPQIIHFNRVFHYKPTILGYPHFWKLAIFNSITNHQIIEN